MQNFQRLRGEVESLTGQKDRLQEEINSRDADREIYWGLLVAALKEGLELRESIPSKEDAQQWASRLHKLLEDAEGEWRVKPFRRPTPGYAYADLDATGEQAFMDYQLSKLQDLVQLIHSRQIRKFPIQLRPSRMGRLEISASSRVRNPRRASGVRTPQCGE